MRAIPFLLATILTSSSVFAAPPVDKAKIDAALGGIINSNALVGVSALVYQDGQEAYFGAFGKSDREAGKPMTRDTLVQIFSMTKPVTGVALMSLYEEGKFNLALADVGGSVLLVSQFTLYADTRRGRRPSFTEAAPPEVAQGLVERCAGLLRAAGVPVETGRFGAHMEVSLLNDGPVTVLLDSR